MTAETQRPDAILAQTNLAGAVTDIDDDPDAPDALWLTASGNNVNTDVRVSYPTPTGDPTVGADLQEFRAQVRQFDTGQTGTPPARIELWENGVFVRAGADVNVTGAGQVIAFTWNASELGTADGSLVECKVVGTKSGGSPSSRNTVEVGAVEWNVEFTTGGSTFEESVSETLTLAASEAVAVTFEPSLSEALGLAASEGADAVFEPAISEALALADALGPELVIDVSRSEPLTLADSLIGGLLVEESLSEGIALGASEGADVTFDLAVAEALGFAASEGADAVFEPAISEALALADALGPELVIDVSRSEPLALADGGVGGLLVEESISEALGLADTQASDVTFEAALSEALGLADALATDAVFEAALTEAIALTDAEIGALIVDATLSEALILAATEAGEVSIILITNFPIGTVLVKAAIIAEVSAMEAVSLAQIEAQLAVTGEAAAVPAVSGIIDARVQG